MSNSFLGKALFIVSVIVLATISIFFVLNKDEIDKNSEEIEIITGLNANSYDYDYYIYDISGNTLYTSQYFYNKIYLDNNEVEYNEIEFNEESRFFLKNLTNSEEDINDIKITYDPISLDEFEFLLENYSLLKVHVWMDGNGECEKILLYSNSNSPLELSGDIK